MSMFFAYFWTLKRMIFAYFPDINSSCPVSDCYDLSGFSSLSTRICCQPPQKNATISVMRKKTHMNSNSLSYFLEETLAKYLPMPVIRG